jgi:hypothetical protein
MTDHWTSQGVAGVLALASLLGGGAVAAEGVIVRTDPKTGAVITSPPPAGTPQPPMTPEEQKSLDTSTEGLTERPLPQGGKALDLKGRFHNR